MPIVLNSAANPVEMLPGVVRRTLTDGDKMMLCEIRMEAGAVVPLHTHPHEQTGYLVSGRCRFKLGDEVRGRHLDGPRWRRARGHRPGGVYIRRCVLSPQRRIPITADHPEPFAISKQFKGIQFLPTQGRVSLAEPSATPSRVNQIGESGCQPTTIPW